ncbi:putative uncharacterized protein BRD3OS isoform X2 [Rousettus aegyptiacus]|uniref:putative uncharacterized protein BRD3OS isoform X2 n=1 Tax=Rousettus aegyptiacus TaxID=9407 RepID=UPI00168CBEB4|nr:putative uncharacterized protein BRD3OS isoform X2 [Rousettus aegyptiacus]
METRPAAGVPRASGRYSAGVRGAARRSGASGCLEQRGCAGGWRHLGEEPQTKSAERTLAARPECHPALSPGELARAPGREGGHGCRQQLPSRRTAPVQPGRRV